MGNNIDLITYQQLNYEVNELDKLYLQLGNYIGRKDENIYIKELLKYFVQNYYDLNPNIIEDWWKRREQLFLSVDELIWSNPKMFDNTLCELNFPSEEMKTLTMTSNTKNKISKYLKKLNCIIDDEFSIIGNFNWEEYIGIRLQCYVNLMITLRRLQLKLLDYDKNNYFGLNKLLFKTNQSADDVFHLMDNVFNKNFGNLETYTKINQIFLKQKLTNNFKRGKLDFVPENEISKHLINFSIPKSLDEIYKKNASSSEIFFLVRCVLGFIWSYYKVIFLSNELVQNEMFHNVDNLFLKEIITDTTDKNTMLCLSEVIQTLVINIAFNSMISESTEKLCLLEDLIKLVLQFGNNILLSVCENKSSMNNCFVSGSSKVTNSNSENKNLLMKMLENMFSEDGFFFNIVKICLIVISILTTGVNHFLAKNGQKEPNANQNLSENDEKNGKKSQKGCYFSNDLYIITMIMRLVSECKYLMQRLWNLYIFLSNEVNCCNSPDLIKEEIYCFGPMQFHSSPRNTFIVEFHEKHSIGIINASKNKLNKRFEFEILEKHKYYWKLIRVQNASHIIIFFDSNCSTKNNTDVLEIFRSQKNYSSDKINENFNDLRSQYNESLFGKLSGPKHLWPKKPIIYEGNTLLVVFRTSIESLDQMSDDMWGFRIYFQCHYWNQVVEKKISHNISENKTEFKRREILLFNLKEVFIFAVTAVSSSLSFMLRGPSIKRIEKNFNKILDSVLFAGGLDINYEKEFLNLSDLRKSDSVPSNTENKKLAAFADFNSHSKTLIDSKNSIHGSSLNNGITLDKKVNNNLFYKCLPNIDEIKDQIINNLHWGFIVNYVLSFSSIIHYNAKKNHFNLSTELMYDKTFMNIVKNDLITARFGSEQLSTVVRSYISCYLHHLGLYYNIFQLCESLLNFGFGLERIIQLAWEFYSNNNLEYIYNNFLFEFLIKFILKQEYCQPLLNVWTLGRKFRSWMIMEKHKIEINQPEEKIAYDSRNSIETDFDDLLKSIIYNISLILNLVPFSGNKNTTIYLKSDLIRTEYFMDNFCKEASNNFDIGGSKYVFYPNRNICLVLESMIGFNKYESLNKYNTEKSKSSVNFESNKDSFIDVKPNFLDDTEVGKLNINQIIREICDGIENLIKSANYFGKMKCNEFEENFIGMDTVLRIRRFRAISRFEAFRILSKLFNDENINEFLLTSLIKIIRSMGEEVPYLSPINNYNETGILESHRHNYLYFSSEYYKKDANHRTFGVHYSDNIVGCGKQVQKQVKDAYFKLLNSLINGKAVASKGAEILKISLFAYFALKKTESYDFLKTGFPARILYLMTGCNKNCELGNECVPSVLLGPYPVFLVYSIICLKCSLQENSAIKLSLIFSSFVGLSHSISISGEFKGQLTSRELWRISEIYFMGKILILTSKMPNFLKKIEISKTEQKIYLEYLKYIFNRRHNFNSSIKSSELIDDLFIKFFYIKPSILSNIICRALDSSNQILHFYCIKFLWKFLPLTSTKDFLEQYSGRLIPNNYLIKSKTIEKLNYIGCFEGYLEKIGQSLVLFNSFEEESKIHPPVVLVNSLETGLLYSFNNQLGSLLDNTNRFINNNDEFYKNLIFLLRLIVLYSEKSEQKYNEVSSEKIDLELIHKGFVQLLSEQIYKIPTLLDSLLNFGEYIQFDEVYKCIGMLAVIIDDYDYETYVGKLIYFQENRLIESKNKICKMGILISNDPLKKEYSILINDFKSIEVKKFSYNSINILNKTNISFPVKFIISKLNFDVIKIITSILNISFQYLSSLSANIENLETYFSIKIMEYGATIPNFEKKKLVGLQIISMSLSFINILLNNGYISTLYLSNDRNLNQLIELINAITKIGIVNLPSINEKENGISNKISIILSRRFIQRTLQKNQFSISGYYPIFKKSTQADLLKNSPFANIMLTLPTKWKIKNQCFYFKNKNTIIFNIDSHLSQDKQKSAMFIANCCIPTLLSFYYFEINFSLSNEIPKQNELKTNFCFLNESDLAFYISIGLYRDGCQEGISGSFGSYAYKNAGKLLHSCNEKEFNEYKVENFYIGDTVGCGIDFSNRVVFFTKNGRIIRYQNSQYAFMQESPCIKKNDYPKFNNVMGHFRPAIWIERSNCDFDTDKYLIVNANFGQELFKYKYINKLDSNNILSLENEELSIFRNNSEQLTFNNFLCNNYNEFSKAELNRRTLAYELHEIINNDNFPLSVCIHALENCKDNLELAADWLLEKNFQNSSSASITSEFHLSSDSTNNGIEARSDGKKCNKVTYSEKEYLIDKVISSKNKSIEYNSSKYFELINALIFNNHNQELNSIKDHYFDISKYFLIFGSFGENPLHRIENYILTKYSQNENIKNYFSTNIWFNSQFDFEGYDRKDLPSEFVQQQISNLTLQLLNKRNSFTELSSSHKKKENTFLPGTIVEIAQNIKYWMNGVEEHDYFAPETILMKSMGTIIDLSNSPKCRTIYFLRRLSKLTGVVWSCNQVTNSTLVQFFDYYSLVYYLVNLPSNFLIKTSTNIGLSDERVIYDTETNLKSFQDYIENIFSSNIHNKNGRTFFYGKLPQVFHLYIKFELIKCIQLAREAISKNLNKVHKYLFRQSNQKRLNSLENILQLFKLVFGSKFSKILDYFVPMYTNEKLFSIYYTNLLNHENMIGYIHFLEEFPKKETIKFIDIILREYISTIKTGIYSEIPIIRIETTHPCEFMIDKKYNISFKDCDYFFGIFDPLCEISSDNLSFFTITFNEYLNGKRITLLKGTGRELSGCKIVIPTNSFTIHLVTSSQDNNKYGIKACFIPIRYSISDYKLMENKNIHFSYILLDLILKNVGNNIDLTHLKKIVEILLFTLFEIHIPKQIYAGKQVSNKNISSFSLKDEKVIPIQNSFIHIVQQLINIFIKYPEVICDISQKSIFILDYLNTLSNIVYLIQMDQLQIVTNHGRIVNIKYCIMLQLHYLLFFYKNNKMDFLVNNKYSQESNFAELNLAVHDSKIKYYHKNKNFLCNIPDTEIYSLKKYNNQKETVSNFLLNGDIKTHNLITIGKKSIFNFCKWYNIISTSNISIQAFISSITYMYAEKFRTENENSPIKNLYLNKECGSHLFDLEESKSYSYYYEPNTPLVLIEKLGEIQISILSALIIIPFETMSSNNSSLSIDISRFIRECLESMDNKLLLLPKNRLLWLNDQALKSILSQYGQPIKILNNPIIIDYSLKRVLTDEVIISKNVTFTSNDLVVLTTSTLDDAQDRVKLLWDLLIHLKNKDNSKLLSNNVINWMENWEDEFISMKVKDNDSFDPRIHVEYLNTYSFPKIKKKNKLDSSKQHDKKTKFNSLLESQPIQLMREFFVKSYSESIFQRKYWPVFIGTIPIRDFETSNHYSSSSLDYNQRLSENKSICDSQLFVSNLREMNVPCSVSFWLFPINLDKYQDKFSISNNKKFEIYKNKINGDFEECKLSEKKMFEYSKDGKWKLIAYRGITVSTISFWITETGNLGIIVNSPNKNYPSNLILSNNTVNNYSQVSETLTFSSFIQNKSSAIELHTTIIISNRKINFDQWNHITVTIGSKKKTENFSNSRIDDSHSIKLYINGLFDDCKNIPKGNIPLIGGDLPWIIGCHKYLKTDSLNNQVFQSAQDDSLMKEIPNIFLGQDISSSKLLRYLGSNKNYLELVTGEPLFGLVANFIVIHFEWEIENIHDYIKKTFDEILFQDELDEINNSEGLLNSKSNPKITRICPNSKFRNSSKYSILHVFSNNWKNKPIVSHFNNIWQQEYINIKISSNKEVKTEEINREKELLNISIPKIFMHNNIFKRKMHIKLDIVALEKLEIISYEELIKNNQKTIRSMDQCPCKDSPIDTIIIIGKNNFEGFAFVLKLKYLNNLFSDSVLNKLKKELDIIFEKEFRTSDSDSFSNNVNQNLNILHDMYSNHDIIEKFEHYCNFNSKNTNDIFIQKGAITEYTENKQNTELEELENKQFSEISSEEVHEIIPSAGEYINFLFNEIKLPEPIFSIFNHLKPSIFEKKVGCQNCKVVILNYLNICNTILKRISILFVSIFSFIEIVSPRPSIFKYSWLKMARRYLSLSLKEVLINLCLAITEDSKADGKVRVAINRTKSMLGNKEILYFDDQFIFESVFGQLYIILEKVPIYRLRCKKRPWYVIYEGEGGIDAGGIYRDLLSHICLELQSDKLPLFVACPNSYGYGENQFYFVPNPSLGKKFIFNDSFKVQQNTSTHLKDINSEEKVKYDNSGGCIKLIYDSLYIFIGRLMGVSIRTQIPLNLDIPNIIWKLILGESVSLNDLKQIDLYSVKFYLKLKQIESNWKNSDIEDKSKKGLILKEFDSLQLNWYCLNINGEVVELKLGGEKIPVEIDELEKYCNLFKEYKLEREFLHATNNIRKGITEIIPENILELQTCEELERLICGNPSLDIDVLKQHTKYTGYSSNDKIINWFWDVLSELTVFQQQMFLRFVWGRSRLPSKGAQWDCNMEIVRVYASENAIYGGGTIIVENVDRIPSFSNLNSEEFQYIENELEHDNSQLNTELIDQSYLREQSISNIISGDISIYGKKEDHLLPTSHTCFFQLELPGYSSKKILKEKLLYAITEGVAIDIDNVVLDIN
ncbi:HECT-domain (ubiquitin-transferase) family protein [Cryptosporidium meleagridis]|uniref:HECT-domain (Ubiquitin-transferase) family protein n=1 Tax=Cryptosporidium meleagridis TaxID=93969 RepID=A0A2P4YWB3_9CRYT|nr:HECT-domain (ubiquitin-transferase) family protein [Cryptosporidium meleagridis]